VSRAQRAGLAVPVSATDDIGASLFALVTEAVAAGVDPEAALRRTARAYRESIMDREAEMAGRKSPSQ
jgi:XTP/dITP diphosphohydrolase